MIDYNLPMTDYHRAEGISKTALDKVDQSPAHYLHWLQEPEPEPTDAMQTGKAFHMAVLEPDLFESEVITAPEVNKRTNKGKQELKDFHAEHSDKLILRPDQTEIVQAMRDSIYQHRAARACLSAAGFPEVSVFWEDFVTGETLKCRPDHWRQDNIILDLKAVRDASPEGFRKAIFNYRYHVQAALYQDGVQEAYGERPQGFIFVACEKEPPYMVGVYTLDLQSLQLGHMEYRRNLETLNRCKATNRFPGYGDEIQEIEPPVWAKKKLEQQEEPLYE